MIESRIKVHGLYKCLLDNIEDTAIELNSHIIFLWLR